MDSLVLAAPSAPPAILVLQATLGHQGRKDNSDSLDSRASWEHLVLLGLEDLMDLLARAVT